MLTAWLWFSSLCTVLFLLFIAIRGGAAIAKIPIIDPNGVSVFGKTKKVQIAIARAMAKVIGDPAAILNTNFLDRYLFPDGTGVDYLKEITPSSQMYTPCAVKSVVLGLFSRKSPLVLAGEMKISLAADGFRTQIIWGADPAFPQGDIVLVLSEAFLLEPDHGFGVIIRKHALRIGGKQRPKRFTGLY